MDKLVFFLLLLWNLSTQAQFVPVASMDAYLLVSELMGESMSFEDAVYEGHEEAIGLFKNDSTDLEIKSGVVLSTGSIYNIPGPNQSPAMSGDLHASGHDHLGQINPTYKTNFDATSLSFRFVAKDEVLVFNYCFGSDEYPEYVGTGYNDAFAFILTNEDTETFENLAVVPFTGDMISVNTINFERNSDFYKISNYGSPRSIEFDGVTSRLTAYAHLETGNRYRIELVIADFKDPIFDSGIFIEGHSFEFISDSTFNEQYKGYLESFDSSHVEIISLPEETLPKQDTVPCETTIYFDLDESALSDSAVAVLDSILSLPIHGVILLQGHTCDLGSTERNARLAADRALAVKNHLEDVENVEVESFGERRLNHSKSANRWKSRRVLISYSVLQSRQ